MTDPPPTQRAALLRTIVERPHDVAMRLVYADWLEEHAELVETPCPTCSQHANDPANPFGPNKAGYRPERDPASGRHEGGWTNCKTCNCGGRRFARPGIVVASNGYSERAEFIRVQCELAEMEVGATPAFWSALRQEHTACEGCSPWCRLRRREQLLLAVNWPEWAGTPGFWYCDNLWQPKPTPVPHVLFRRGFVEYVTLDTAVFVGDGTCQQCNGLSGSASTLYHPCAACNSTGRTPGRAGPLALATPLTGVTLSDCGPYQDDLNEPETFAWIEQTRRDFEQERTDGGTPSSVIGSLHKDLFRLLKPHPKFAKSEARHNRNMPDGRRWTYPTIEAADLARDWACVTYARQRAPTTHRVTCPRCKGRCGKAARGWNANVPCDECAGSGSVERPGLPELKGRQ